MRENENGKPVEKRGRKAKGLRKRTSMTAGYRILFDTNAGPIGRFSVSRVFCFLFMEY